jgi:uncharacterized protein
MRQKLNLITFGVLDLKKSTAFYEGLGWKKSAASIDDLVLFPLGGITLALYPREELAKDAMVKNNVGEFSGLTISFNAKSVEEVDSVMKEVQQLGATIIKRAQKAFWGGYSGYFRDPDGHIIEVAHNPFWELDENDNLKL